MMTLTIALTVAVDSSARAEVAQSDKEEPPGKCVGDKSRDSFTGGCYEPPSSPGSPGQPDPEPVNDESKDAGDDGDDSNCEWIHLYTFDPEAPDADPTINLTGRKQHLYHVYCESQFVGYRWVDAVDGGPPSVTPEDLVPGVWVSVQRRLPTPVPRVAPSDTDADGYAYVQTPTFFWVDQAQGQWATVSGTASASGLSVSVEAVPQELVVNTGDGATMTCPGAPPAFPTGSDPATFDGCEYEYTDSSAMAPNGETFPVTVSIVWHASWSASNGESGDLGEITTTSPPRQLPVAEIQAVVVQG